MPSPITKLQKIQWIKAARLRWSRGNNEFTCNCFEWGGGRDARLWYVQTCAYAMDGVFASGHSISYLDFVGNKMENFGRAADEHRQLWLAMLLTLAEAGEI